MMSGRSRRNERGWRGAQIALGLVAAGCSSSKEIGGDPATTFCESYLHAVTSKVVLCQGGSTTVYNERLQTLDVCSGISTDLTLGKLTYSPPMGQACLSEIAALDCGTLVSQNAAPTACLEALTGTVAAGSACFPIQLGLAQECAPGNHCASNAQCPGVCQPDGSLGAACDEGYGAGNQCASPLICSYTVGSGATCVAPSPDVQVGAACGSTSACISDNVRLVCDGPSGPLDALPPVGAPTGGTCQKARATGPCAQNSDCSTNNCLNASSGAGVCAQLKGAGETCVPGQNQCAPTTYCGTTRKCVDLPAVGRSCAGNAGEGTSCANGACDPLTSLCVPFLWAGQTCGGAASQCDGYNTQCSASGVCVPTCAPGSVCAALGQICCGGQGLCSAGLACNGTTCTVPPPGTDGGFDAHVSTGIAITPNAMGTYDGTRAAGVVGAWWATGDDYDSSGTPGAGNCPMAGFPNSECSSIATPTPGQPFVPTPINAQMCTKGVAAQVIDGDGGTLAYSAIWGDMIGFDLDNPGPDAGTTTKGQYDAPAHGITGIAFDIDTPPFGNLRVEFQTLGTENNAAFWGGTASDGSPVFAGHNEIRWSAVGGPFYLTNPPPFDPTKLESVTFHVVANPSTTVPYSFCVNNVIMLTN